MQMMVCRFGTINFFFFLNKWNYKIKLWFQKKKKNYKKKAFAQNHNLEVFKLERQCHSISTGRKTRDPRSLSKFGRFILSFWKNKKETTSLCFPAPILSITLQQGNPTTVKQPKRFLCSALLNHCERRTKENYTLSLLSSSMLIFSGSFELSL